MRLPYPASLAERVREDLLNRVDEELDGAFEPGSDWSVEQLAVAVLRLGLDVLTDQECTWDEASIEALADRLNDWLTDNRSLS